MRFAVAQHASSPDSSVTAVPVVRAALERSTDLVICPASMGVAAEEIASALDRVVGAGTATYLLPTAEAQPPGSAAVVDFGPVFPDLGRMAVFVGDACFERAEWLAAREAGVTAAVLCPLSESDLQSEAALEVAIALSESLCGLVIVAEAAGADSGEPGHGGSAIISLGEVLAEGFSEPDVLVAEVALPAGMPEPPELLPELPTLLAQRLASHAGRRLEVDYPADLSDSRPKR